MKKLTFSILTILTIVLISGCASSYRNINPPSINYNSHDISDGISFSYKYDVLREKGNRKYAKKENRKSIKLVAVKITNYTDTIINIGQNITFNSRYKQLTPLEPILIKKQLRQSAPSYLLYLLLAPLKLYVTNENSVETYSIGYIISPILTLGNLLFAADANSDFYKELNEYNLLNRNINKGETVYGLIGINNADDYPITIKRIYRPNETRQSTTAQEIKDENVFKNPESQIYELKENLYKNDTSISYQTYYNKTLSLANNIKFVNAELVQEEYSNGNIKSIGIKAKHKLDNSTDDLYSNINSFYKIGTWRYFHENGQLWILVDYDLTGKKSGQYIEYDNLGNLLKEINYK